MMKFTIRQKGEGEMMVRRMSRKAQIGYYSNDVEVYADDRGAATCFVRIFYGYPEEMTFKEAEATLEFHGTTAEED